MGDYNAIRAGTDLSAYARELARTHEKVLAGGHPSLRPRALVSRSWQRVLDFGLDPDDTNNRDPLGIEDVLRRRESSPLRLVIDDLIAVVRSIADASQLLMVVTDADGVILWREGSSAVRRRADRLGFGEGARWTEAMVGTNAIGTALAEAAPVQLFSAEHFEANQHPWYCTAAPIHDPRTGELLGIVDVSGPALTLHPAIGALVETGVRLAESTLWRRHEQRLARLRRAAAPLLATLDGPMLLVDEHGWVAHNSGIAVRERIAAPRAERALTVPGLGLCLPEPLGEGWLIRGAAAGPGVVATLELTRTPTLRVSAAGRSWRSTVTARHAEILILLRAAGPAGRTAGRLSRDLYGDAEHVVAVRAEVSRLRRDLGALVDTRPYRLAEGVTLTLDPGEAGSLAEAAFLSAARSPGVRAAAAGTAA
ncbi:MAG TPA: GAF domain-containing protein [Pseudonocardiaceae bacterium]|nr:GAF domain-containing protein [Pseudonocardiaceae bacterium]